MADRERSVTHRHEVVPLLPGDLPQSPSTTISPAFISMPILSRRAEPLEPDIPRRRKFLNRRRLFRGYSAIYRGDVPD
jgi:hypothetical protein